MSVAAKALSAAAVRCPDGQRDQYDTACSPGAVRAL